MVKSGAEKSMCFMQLFLYYTIFGETYWLKTETEYSWISVMKKQNSKQNVKVGRMVALFKAFDHYHHKFLLFQLSCKIEKEFEAAI